MHLRDVLQLTMNQAEIQKTIIESPLGPLLCGASERGIVGLYFDGVHQRQPKASKLWVESDDGRFDQVREQLAEYFQKSRQTFQLNLDTSAMGTPFMHQVWDGLQKIPYGETISYADLAKRVGSPKAVRAVGMANARNPISIIVPCHRVIAANGKLTGYAGGMDRKRYLLNFEYSQESDFSLE